MAKTQHAQPDKALMNRLHAACKPSLDKGALRLRENESGDYLIESADSTIKRGTLGSSINYNPRNA